jgi:hypothetical protein
LHVVIARRTPGKLEQVVTSTLAAGGSTEAMAMDATNEADVVKLFDHAMAPANGREPLSSSSTTLEAIRKRISASFRPNCLKDSGESDVLRRPSRGA